MLNTLKEALQIGANLLIADTNYKDSSVEQVEVKFITEGNNIKLFYPCKTTDYDYNERWFTLEHLVNNYKLIEVL